MHPIPKGLVLKAITQKVDSSAVAHPNGEKVARSFADRPVSVVQCSASPMMAASVSFLQPLRLTTVSAGQCLASAMMAASISFMQ